MADCSLILLAMKLFCLVSGIFDNRNLATLYPEGCWKHENRETAVPLLLCSEGRRCSSLRNLFHEIAQHLYLENNQNKLFCGKSLSNRVITQITKLVWISIFLFVVDIILFSHQCRKFVSTVKHCPVKYSSCF